MFVALCLACPAPVLAQPEPRGEKTSTQTPSSAASFDRLTRLARQLAAEDAGKAAAAGQATPDAPPPPTAPPKPDTRIKTPKAPATPTVAEPDAASPLAEAAAKRSAGNGQLPLGSRNESLPLGRQTDRDGDHDSADADPAFGPGWVLNTFTALAIVIGLIFVARAAYMKLSGQPIASSGTQGPVRVLSRTSVAPKSQVLLLSVGDRVLVVGDSAAGLRTLDVVDDAEETASLMAAVEASRPQSISRGFGDLLSRVNGDYDRQMSSFEGQDHSEHRVDRARDSVSSLLSRVRNYTRPGTQEAPAAQPDSVELSLGSEGRVA